MEKFGGGDHFPAFLCSVKKICTKYYLQKRFIYKGFQALFGVLCKCRWVILASAQEPFIHLLPHIRLRRIMAAAAVLLLSIQEHLSLIMFSMGAGSSVYGTIIFCKGCPSSSRYPHPRGCGSIGSSVYGVNSICAVTFDICPSPTTQEMESLDFPKNSA